MNRIDRVTAILIQLQSRKIVKAQEIADRFKISLRTVYRDVKTLEEAGIPILGEAGVGYSIMEGYRLPPVMFTKDEATAFLTAEKMIEKLADGSTDESFKSAMYKVRAVLRSAEKDLLEDLDENIHVRKSMRGKENPIEVNSIQPILKSIGSKQVLAITYVAGHSQESTDRCVEPIGIIFAESVWHLIAWCQLRKDYRNFRIDRIKSIRITDNHFDHEHPSLKSHLEKMRADWKLYEVIIVVKEKAMRYLSDQKYYHGFISEKKTDEGVEMRFLTYSVEGFLRWFIMFADFARIVTPEELQRSFEKLYVSIGEKHQMERVSLNH